MSDADDDGFRQRCSDWLAACSRDMMLRVGDPVQSLMGFVRTEIWLASRKPAIGKPSTFLSADAGRVVRIDTSPGANGTARVAPWSDEQVAALNIWQGLGYVHEFTCPNTHDGTRVLHATRDGWVCPSCDYRQDWAYYAMLDRALHPRNPLKLGQGGKYEGDV